MWDLVFCKSLIWIACARAQYADKIKATYLKKQRDIRLNILCPLYGLNFD